jgi:phytoene desaturase
MNQTAIIIGAGYGGMATANLLAKAGYKVSVYDKNPTTGGRISAIKKNGFTFDVGPSWYLMPEVFEQYYQLFDLSAKERLDIVRFSPAYKVHYENTDTLVIHGSIDQDKQTFETIEPGSAKVLERYLKTNSLAYQLSLEHFLYNNFKKVRDVFRWPIIRNAPRMIRLMSQNLDDYVSKYFRSKQLKQLLEYHMVFLGSSPFQAPAIYTLMSHLDLVSGVYYPRRGMLSLADDMKAIGSELGVTYNLGVEVQKILVEHGRASGIELADGSRVRADVVISNADVHHTEAKLLEREYQSFPQKYWDARQAGPSALLVSLGVRGALPSLNHHNLFFCRKVARKFS